jgi:hypothetical protein
MEMIRLSETSVHTRTTRLYILVDSSIHGNKVFTLFFDRRRKTVFVQQVLNTNTSELMGRYTLDLSLW